MKKIVIVQPYIPRYRVPFFNLLFEKLSDEGIDGVVAAASPEGHELSREDSSSASWHVHLSNRQVRVRGHSLTLGSSSHIWRNADAVIVGHMGSSLDTYRAIIAGMRGPLKVGLWGHIKSYVNDSHPVDAALEKWQLKHADQIFAYTPSGTEFARRAGVESRRITTVMNSIDTAALTEAVRSTRQNAIDDFAREHQIDRHNTVAFIGGLDEAKRIAFLAQTLDELWSRNRDIKILVAGRGDQESLLDAACQRGQVVKLGYADAALQALMAQVSRAIVMPGRVGLIAVEALVLNRPIITTDWNYHSAEIEYLEEGKSLITAPNNSSAYATAILSFLAEANEAYLPTNPSWAFPSIEDMAQNFATGVVSMMSRNKND